MKNLNSDSTESLSTLSDSSLVQEIRSLVSEERRLGVQILRYLLEIDGRRIPLALGYSSLFTFCVQELKYTESQAYRRIQAMQALREVPQIEEKLQSGVLSLSSVSQVQSFCRKVDTPDKLGILQSIEGKSKRETEKLLA